MTWITVMNPDGTSGVTYVPDQNIATPTNPTPSVITVPLMSTQPILPNDPTNGVTLDEVLAWYLEFLGRPADVNTEAAPRVGADRLTTYNSIRCSEEAANYRAAHGAEPDSYCFTLVTKPPAVTQPGSGITGGSAGGGGGGGGGGTGGSGTSPILQPPSGVLDLTGLGTFLHQVADALGQVTQGIGQKINDVSVQVGQGLQIVESQIASSVSKFAPVVGNAFNELNSKIGQVVQGLIPTTLSLVGSALGGVESIVSAMFGSMASVDDVIDAVSGRWTKSLEGGSNPLMDAVGAAFGFGIQLAVHAMLPKVDGSSNPIADGLEAAVAQHVERLRGRVGA